MVADDLKTIDVPLGGDVGVESNHLGDGDEAANDQPAICHSIGTEIDSGSARGPGRLQGNDRLDRLWIEAGDVQSGLAVFRQAWRAGLAMRLGLTLTAQTVATADLGDVGRRLLGRPLEVILGRELFDAARPTSSVSTSGVLVTMMPRQPAQAASMWS